MGLQVSEWFALGSEILAAITSFLFITVYAILAEWHKSIDGKLMVLVAAGTGLKCICSIALTGHWGDPALDWLRVGSAIFTLMIGLFFGAMSTRVWNAQLGKVR